jgi:ribosomal protein S18 acetylase RimI-like enzyme
MYEEVQIVKSKAKAIEIIKDVSWWLKSSGKEVSEWWDPERIDHHFFDEYAKDSDFYVLEVDKTPVATAIIQEDQKLQDWSSVDDVVKRKAIYIHYLSVDRRFAGEGWGYKLIDHAKEVGKAKNIRLLRLDTNYDQPKLTQLYEDYGFQRVKILDEDGHRTVLYELHF